MRTMLKNLVAVCLLCFAGFSVKAADYVWNSSTPPTITGAGPHIVTLSNTPTGTLSVPTGETVTINGSISGKASATLTLNIAPDATVNWNVNLYLGNPPSSNPLIALRGTGTFVVMPEKWLQHEGSGNTIYASGNLAAIIIEGIVEANSGTAIECLGANTVVTVRGSGAVFGDETTNLHPVINMTNTSNTGDNVIIEDNARVWTIREDAPYGYCIQTYGNVIINGGDIYSGSTYGRAINLVGSSSIATIIGGKVHVDGASGVAISTATTDPSTVPNASVVVIGGTVCATTGNAIHTTGAHSSVTVSGGIVYNEATTADANKSVIYMENSDNVTTVKDDGIVEARGIGNAIGASGPSSASIVVSGGQVIAKQGYAIRTTNAGTTVSVSGGFVFAHGTALSGTAATPKSVIRMASGGTPAINTSAGSNGVVVAWNYPGGTPSYLALTSDALNMNTSSSVVWYHNGTYPGIAYTHGDNTGFFPLDVQIIFPKPDANGILYVNHTQTGDGSSWALAYPNLADPLLFAAMQRAIPGSSANLITQIWVAEGTYYPLHDAADSPPATPNLRDKAFVLVPDVKIFGGFAGIESSVETRSGGASILSGDIDMDGTSNNNAYHVVVGVGTVANPIHATTILDGFTITGGNADSSGSISVNGVMIDANSGGGMILSTASPTITSLILNGNSANSGGGISNVSSSPILTNVVLCGNYANSHGGGMDNYAASPILTNLTISGNSAVTDGGGMYNISSSPIINNTIIWGNTAATDGNISNDSGSTPVYFFSLVEGSGGSSSWVSSFGDNRDGNLDVDPEFIAPVLSSFAPTTSGDYRLQSISPAIEAGSNALFFTARGISNFAGEIDLAGNPRLLGDRIDIGAYETTVYKVTVYSPGTGASGEGYYGAGQKVDIYAGTLTVANPFMQWITTSTSPGVNFDDLNNDATYFFMPANDVTVIAEFKDLYMVTVSSTGTGAAGGGFYMDGATVSIDAGTPPDGMEFAVWVATPDVAFSDPFSATTTFKMPDNHVTVTAEFCAEGDKKAFEYAQRLFEENEWVVCEQNVFTVERLKTKLIEQIYNLIDSTGITATWSNLTISDIIVPAVNLDGSFSFDITLTKCSHISTLSLTCVIAYELYAPIVRLITINDTMNGQIISDKQYAATRDTVTLTILPDAGYQLDEIKAFHTVYDTIPVLLTGDGAVRTFLMPPHVVTVTATFTVARNVSTPQTGSGLKAYVQDGVLYVSGVTQGGTVWVYTILGTLTASSNSSYGEVFVLPLPGRGIYIITDGQQTIKIKY